jgi:mRNA-degrading endonuclease YafQ of YafQ-DinJ toxin-antitoxin module
MNLYYTDHFRKRLAKRVARDETLKAKVAQQLETLSRNWRHPSLKTHKLQGGRTEQYALRVEGDLRITFIRVEAGFLLTDIITHDEY